MSGIEIEVGLGCVGLFSSTDLLGSYDSISFLVILPPGPDPEISFSDIPTSAASFLAIGVANTSFEEIGAGSFGVSSAVS